MNRIGFTLKLIRVCWRILMNDKRLLVFALLGAMPTLGLLRPTQGSGICCRS
ncbi:MAG: hypothetical protein QHH07_10930 [Sedimentisphaerales bacterium]|nr:hypothetical protein [Sedimentisphaerales bacterium]